jgi:hypothetical protein
MTTRSGDRLTNMIGDTDEEIFDHALDAEPASGGDDKSLEEMDDSLEGNEGRKAGDDDGDSDEGDDGDDDGDGDEADKGDGKDGDKGKSEGDKDGDDKGRTDDDDEPRRGDPKLALREERDRRRTAERERDERVPKEDFNRLLTRLEALERDRSAPARPAERAATEEEPDVFADPQGFKNSIVDAVTRQARLDRVETTFAEAHEEHGKVFETAYAAMTSLDKTNAQDRATVQRIAAAPNPGRALLRWHREQEARREIGDVTTFREREREKLLKDPETRKQLLRELRREAEGRDDDEPDEPRARNAKRNLPSLNSGTRGGTRRGRDQDPGLYDDSEESVFDHATR